MTGPNVQQILDQIEDLKGDLGEAEKLDIKLLKEILFKKSEKRKTIILFVGLGLLAIIGLASIDHPIILEIAVSGCLFVVYFYLSNLYEVPTNKAIKRLYLVPIVILILFGIDFLLKLLGS